MSQFLRTAAAVPVLHLGQPQVNAEHILSLVQKAAEAKTNVIVFPELALTGYTCQDLFFEQSLQDQALKALNWLQSQTSKLDITIIVGLPLSLQDRLFNVAAVLHQGNLLGIVPKTFLPNYNEFYEQRWFASAADLTLKLTMINGRSVCVMPNQLFKSGNITWGIEICEDLWAVTPPSNNLALHGAQVIFNPSASNELVGKANYRRDLIRQQSGRLLAGYVYTSAGPMESASDTVFSGHALIAENDKVLAESTRFSFEPTLIISDIAISELIAERQRNCTFTEQHPTNEVSINHYTTQVNHTTDTFLEDPKQLRRNLPANPFVPADETARAQVCEEIINIQSTALQRKLRTIGSNTKIVIGISGGLDSTQALLVAVDAIDKLGRSRKDIIGYTLPGLGTTSRTKSNAWTLMTGLGIDAREINISTAVLQHFKDIGQSPDKYDITYENAQARERMQVLFDSANKEGAIVLGTGDLSETFLGWCTYLADSHSHLHVNAGIPKTLIRYLVQYFSTTTRFANVSVALKDVYDTPVSPELLPADAKGNIAQNTENSVGPYELVDFAMYWILRKHASPRTVYLYMQIAWGHKYSKATMLRWLKDFYSRFFRNQFKRNSAPDGTKVGSVSLSQRADWRMPSDMSSKMWLAELERL